MLRYRGVVVKCFGSLDDPQSILFREFMVQSSHISRVRVGWGASEIDYIGMPMLPVVDTEITE